MQLFDTGRWPSVWDAEQLKEVIEGIVKADTDFAARFYQQGELRGPFACQGDIVAFRSSMPLVDANGNIIATEREFEHWMVLGNTCDMDRVDTMESTIVPLIPIRPTPSNEQLSTLRSYTYYKQFYVPPWTNSPSHQHHLAQFVNPVTIAKKAFRDDCAKVVARLEFAGWALLHACLVRYLARDDGRFD